MKYKYCEECKIVEIPMTSTSKICSTCKGVYYALHFQFNDDVVDATGNSSRWWYVGYRDRSNIGHLKFEKAMVFECRKIAMDEMRWLIEECPNIGSVNLMKISVEPE